MGAMRALRAIHPSLPAKKILKSEKGFGRSPPTIAGS
jgi:hypothetical protein